MQLTGKCKEDFFKEWDINEEKFLEAFSDREITSIIIDWFDSKNMNLHIEVVYDRSSGYVRGFDSEVIFIMHGDFTVINSDCLKNDVYETRLEATDSVIKKANELYNMLHFETNPSKN